MMDQGLKYMVGIYVGIFLVVGIFAFSTGGSGESAVVSAGLDAKTKSAVESLESEHKPFNQVKFSADDQPLFEKTKSGRDSANQALNIVKFRAEPHQAFNQVGFSLTDTDKVKQGEPASHRPLNVVGFNRDSQPHQAFNVVKFEKKD